ncbi:hypothetical protein OPV22_029635 [Ensete ventricosum]|uniref:RING-type E3 ubiquitin transferase n=1 Tax=Ensete ventricosum TaxID=4639 RepID=A0AAV8Q9T3_ENSVE|nr:hypothetical protein OPV22_029635 [Ensete ventricosum]
MPIGAADDGGRPPASTAVAIDKDKNSQQAVKWAIDHLLLGSYAVILIHVKTKPPMNHETASDAIREQAENEMSQLFLPFRGFCARKGVHMTEVVLEDNDVSKAIIDYINANYIQNIVVGASSRNALTKKFRNPDVPTNIGKLAPEFCAVYVISKGKPVTVRTAKGPPPLASQPSVLADPDDSIKTPFTRAGYRGTMAPGTPDRRSFEKNMDHIRTPSRERQLLAGRTPPGNVLLDGIDSSHRPPRPSTSRDMIFDDLDFQAGTGFQSMDFGSMEISSTSSDSPKGSLSPNSGAQRELEAEMRRLKLELKQTMEMYSTACKEAISAKQKAKELHQWKLEEARRVEEAKHAEEMALALAEMEKAKCKAALEMAEAAQRIAEQEARKRLNAEMKAKREAEEKVKALDALAMNDLRYRKYSIEEIEIATDQFSASLKIGEGGYGPVYRACLDHTPVAIKVLRPDAAQGRKQFQQEVEVLSSIRHPNMVLLLGACPEYGCLVYEYMDSGSLEDRLFRRGNTPSIPWSVRFKIAAEIATGLLFLHQAKPEPLVHRDLKPGNILLDRNYVSKISDVGLARLVPPSVANQVTQYRMTSTAGTFCYIDPEYQQTGMLGTKSDIYSFGIMLLQIITAKPPMGLTHHVERAIERGSFTDMLDATVKDWPVEEALGFAKLALKCAELRRKDRPDLGTVVLPELNRLRNLGHAYEDGFSGGGGGSGIPSTASSNSNSSSSFGNGPQTLNGNFRATSLANQEKAMITPNRRNIKQNIILTSFPAFLCLLIISIQSVVNNELDKPRYHCGCKCIDANGSGTCRNVCGMQFSTSIQAIACPVPRPQEWPALVQVPSAKYRAVRAAYHNLPGLPDASCFKDHSCAATSLFTGQNESIAKKVDCMNNLYLWRENSSIINEELFQGYRKGNPAHKISEYVGAYDFLNTSEINFNVNLWYNSTYSNQGKPRLLRIPGTLNMVSNAFLRQFKSSKSRILLSYVKEMPKAGTRIALDLSELLGLDIFRRNNYPIQCLFYGVYINLQIVLAFLTGIGFSDVHSAAGKTLFVMELIPGFSLYRGLYELSQFALGGHYQGTYGMQWKDLSNHDNGIKEVLVIMTLEWLILLYVSYYLDQLALARNGASRYSSIFTRNFKNGSIRPTVPVKIPSSIITVDQENSDISEEVCKVENLLKKSTGGHPIILSNLEKVYTGKDGNPNKQAVQSLSLAVAEGECLGMLGPNGSGKTTVINMVTGLLLPTSGRVFLSNKGISSSMDNIHAKIGICPQKDLLWDSLTGREHLMFYGRLRNLKGLELQQAVDNSLRSLDLYEGNVGDHLAGTYSGGMKRRLSVAISLIGDTQTSQAIAMQVVLLDEPTTGLDPDSRNYLWHAIKLAKRDRTIILTTHLMDEAEFLCDRLAIIVNGRLTCVGSSSELKTRYGGSYQLTISADPINKDIIEDMITSLCSEAMKIYDVVGTQRFRLPKQVVRVQEIFKVIDVLKKVVAIHAFEVISASIEDVFSNVVNHALESEIA